MGVITAGWSLFFSGRLVLRIPDKSDTGNKEYQSQDCIDGNQLDILRFACTTYKIGSCQNEADSSKQGKYNSKNPSFPYCCFME